MNKKKTAVAVLAAGAALLAGTAGAGPMFRCGNVFQDRPCAGGVQQEIVKPGRGGGSSGGATAATRASPYAGACGRIGEHAQRMAWQREGGATLERQMADLPQGADRQELTLVLQSVYAKRGSATDIRAQVEAECVQRKQDSAAATDAMRDLQQRANQPGGVNPPPPPVPVPEASAVPAAGAAQPQAKGGQPNAMCGYWGEQRSAIEGRMRTGGSAQTMEMYQRQRRELEKQMAQANCP